MGEASSGVGHGLGAPKTAFNELGDSSEQLQREMGWEYGVRAAGDWSMTHDSESKCLHEQSSLHQARGVS